MKKKLLGIVLVVVLVLGLGFVYSQFSEKPVEGSKAITIEVVDNAEKSTVYELNTDAEYLRENKYLPGPRVLQIGTVWGRTFFGSIL